MVVHGNGLDEFALHGATQVVEVNGSDLLEYSLTPEDFPGGGLAACEY